MEGSEIANLTTLALALGLPLIVTLVALGYCNGRLRELERKIAKPLHVTVLMENIPPASPNECSPEPRHAAE